MEPFLVIVVVAVVESYTIWQTSHASAAGRYGGYSSMLTIRPWWRRSWVVRQALKLQTHLYSSPQRLVKSFGLVTEEIRSAIQVANWSFPCREAEHALCSRVNGVSDLGGPQSRAPAPLHCKKPVPSCLAICEGHPLGGSLWRCVRHFSLRLDPGKDPECTGQIRSQKGTWRN